MKSQETHTESETTAAQIQTYLLFAAVLCALHLSVRILSSTHVILFYFSMNNYYEVWMNVWHRVLWINLQNVNRNFKKKLQNYVEAHQENAY